MLKFVTLLLLLTLFACVPVTPKSQQTDTERANVHYKMALAKLQSGNPTGALKELLDAVELDPENAIIQIALAQTYQRKKSLFFGRKTLFKSSGTLR